MSQVTLGQIATHLANNGDAAVRALAEQIAKLDQGDVVVDFLALRKSVGTGNAVGARNALKSVALLDVQSAMGRALQTAIHALAQDVRAKANLHEAAPQDHFDEPVAAPVKPPQIAPMSPQAFADGVRAIVGNQENPAAAAWTLIQWTERHEWDQVSNVLRASPQGQGWEEAIATLSAPDPSLREHLVEYVYSLALGLGYSQSAADFTAGVRDAIASQPDAFEIFDQLDACVSAGNWEGAFELIIDNAPGVFDNLPSQAQVGEVWNDKDYKQELCKTVRLALIATWPRPNIPSAVELRIGDQQNPTCSLTVRHDGKANKGVTVIPLPGLDGTAGFWVRGNAWSAGHIEVSIPGVDNVLTVRWPANKYSHDVPGELSNKQAIADKVRFSATKHGELVFIAVASK